MTIKDFLDNDIFLLGPMKVICWENKDSYKVYFSGYHIENMDKKYMSRKILCLEPSMFYNNEAGILIEVDKEF